VVIDITGILIGGAAIIPAIVQGIVRPTTLHRGLHGRQVTDVRPTPVNREDRRTYDHLVVNLPLEEGPRALVRQELIHLQEDVHLLQENRAPERRHLHARVLAIQ
jgi:hypothetical protein